jgi:hypothetical protein
MITYLETVIVQSIDVGVMPPSTKSPETDGEFLARLCTNSIAVACKKQVYSSNHHASRFRYSRSCQWKDAYRFGMLRELLSSSEVDELGVIRLSRKGLDAKVIPAFLPERSITIKGYSVRKKPAPMRLAFSLTDYKVKGSMLMTAVLTAI